MSLDFEHIDALLDRELEVLPVESIRSIILSLSMDVDAARAYAAAWKRLARIKHEGLKCLALENVKLRQEIAHMSAPPARLAERVRAHVIAKYFRPARKAGHRVVAVSPLNVHKSLGLRQRYTDVVAAMTSRKFLTEQGARVRKQRFGEARPIIYEFRPEREKTDES